MKLEPNMYVRDEKGIIGKIYKKKGDMFFYKDSNRDYITYGKLHNEIIKASHNIIGLIEVGDYVNGCMVINKKDDTIQIIQLIIPFDLKEKDIKSIVTREQFESISYKVGE